MYVYVLYLITRCISFIGTTWMQEIVWLLQNDCNFEKASTIPLEERCLFLEMRSADTSKQENQHALKSPKVIKSHLTHATLKDALNKGYPKVIIGLRNPKDVIVSLYHFYRMNKGLGSFSDSFDEFFEMFKNKELLFGDWYDHVLGWWQKHGEPNYHFLRYEDMKKKPFETLSEIAAFLGVTLSEKQLEEVIHYTDFDQMKDNKMVNRESTSFFNQEVSRFIRKGIVGDWKHHFSQEQSAYVDGLCAELKEKGLLFEFE